ncbi:dynein axonemal heavy chain 8 isoform X3 [Nematostella vectensis]|uniref:dynein axonemal heavy chain 8 isoform X3 n=1 Tax=Nematostella vectensis TaxID=45351 RepID=UPI002077869C|nr:dynein axonemal heavy chain 8 isoform X3 [Nematostella vectensis]
MDERHWWFATKLQETFHIGALDNPTMLEDFMAEQTTLDYINDFLAPEGHTKLFFYSPKPDPNSLQTRKMCVTSTCAKLKEVMDEEAICLYFIRSNVNRVIDPTQVEKEVYCGEIKENPLVHFSALLSEAFGPVLHAQKDWGQCTDEEHQHFLNQIDKYTNTLSEYANATVAPQQILKKPESQVTTDFKQNRAAAVNPVILQEYENLVLDWITTIENILTDGLEDRSDGHAGPLSELDRWKRRQKVLTSVTDQLKGKECKAVIAVLITAKSKVLKRWKSMDASITDALNETKDKVRYLESLRKYFDQLYSGAPVGTICSNTLPGLMATVRQMDAVSRFYARNGYLGLLFSKITNQLVTACKNYLRATTMTCEEDKLWTRVQEETEACASGHTIQAKPKAKKKGHKEHITPQDERFLTRLNVCLTLQKQYRDMLRSLRDSLGGSHSLSITPSGVGPGKKQPIGGSNSNVMTPSNTYPVHTRLLISQNSRLKGDHESVTSQGSSGIAFADEESIIGFLDVFCVHVRNMLDIIQTLGQLSRLASDVKNLMRIPTEVVMYGPPENENEQPVPFRDQQLGVSDVKVSRHPSSVASGSEKSYPQEDSTSSGRANGIGQILDEIDEEEKVKEIYSVVVTPSISSILYDNIYAMRSPLETTISTAVFLDVEGQGCQLFENGYTGFVSSVLKIENYICNYLKVLFRKCKFGPGTKHFQTTGVFTLKLNIRKALGILTSFNCVMTRPGLRAVFSEKFLEVFSWFENELEDVQKVYEAEKESPPLVRNAPIVSGAITWSRNLLRRIEEPMRVFKENKFTSSYRDFNRIVKFYNRIATALVKFENLWLSLWKSRVDSACSGLKATLLTRHPNTKQMVVNADGRIFELIHECRCLNRLGVELPENAVEILKQEKRLKQYKQSLELILQDYFSVCTKVPAPLTRLLTPHMESVQHYLQPGLSTLNWNSMNIDAYVHQVHTATNRLREIVNNIEDVIKEGVEEKIEEIRRILLFDPKLAYSKVWQVEDFVEAEGKAIKALGRVLYDLVKDVENALQEVIAIAHQRRITSPGSPLLTPTPSASYGIDQMGHTTPRQTRIGTIMSSAPPTRVTTAVSGLTEESVIGDIFGHYCSLVFDAVLASIVSSLRLVGDCVKPLGRAVSGIQYMGSRSDWDDSDNESEMSDFSGSVKSSWSVTNQDELLKFEVDVRFNIPDIVIEPSLSMIQDGVNKVALGVVNVSRGIMWWAADVNESFHGMVSRDNKVQAQLQDLSSSITSLQSTVDHQLLKFRRYDFLWKDDMHALYHSFVESDPGTARFKEEIEKLQAIEEDVLGIPERLGIGSACLNTSPIKDSLHGLSVAWKMRYSTQLHEEAKIELDKIVTHRNAIYSRLSQPVVTLDELHSAFELLQELGDMENTIDDVYLPVENIYTKLREYKLNLPRKEVEEVDSLRDEWVKLMELAEKVREELLVKKRGMFEQELDKEVKAFVVNVIQFRNSFDSQGPGVPGVRPAEAVARLHAFQQQYTQYESHRKTLDAVQQLFGIVPTPFPELDKTGEELQLLGHLYGLFQQFISFDQRFRETLWSEVDLAVENQEMEHYWQECLRLPQRIQGWEAYKEMRDAIKEYLDVFPILHKLNSKEIRNRHWLQVMSVTGSSFQLEAHIFKLVHLLDIGLLEHQKKIRDICRSASRELELELKMRSIEEEWTEQVLTFENFKNRGLVCLSHGNTEHLLDLLEDAQATLAVMLTSRHIGPLRDEAAAWALKLKEICEVLEQWLTVQDLWKHLEEVFSHGATAKELPQEYNRFARVDKSYMKMMKRAYETKNVLQCCVGGDVPKSQMLKHLFEELEICFKSLMGFLDSKRKVFPRFCFVTDAVLLGMLSKPHNLESVKPYIRCIFSSVRDVTLIQQEPETPANKSAFMVSATHWRQKVRDGDGLSVSGSPKEDVHSARFRKGSEMPPMSAKESESAMRRSSVLQSSTADIRSGDGDWRSTIPQNIATAVSSELGETVQLRTQVPLNSSVDQWLAALLKSIKESLHADIVQCISDIDSNQSVEEWAGKYPAQVCRLGLLYVWTKECEAGITDIRIDRKAIPNAVKRFWSGLSRLPNLLARCSWKHSDGPMPAYHRVRIEALLSSGMYLRDTLDDLGRRKLRDVVDFEWKRNIRFYGSTVKAIDPSPEVQVEDNGAEGTVAVEPFLIHMLDAQLPYGCEFYGDESGLALTPITERCFLSLTQAIWGFSGGALQGPTGTGKTETVKGLAYLLGRYLLTLSCSSRMGALGVGKIIIGLAEEGCWGLLDEFHQVNNDVLSVLLSEIQSVLLAVRAGQNMCTLDEGKEISVHQNFSVFLTFCTTRHNYELPPEVHALFRSVSMVMPDVALILRAQCAGQGFKSPRMLADRLKLVTEICSKQLGASVQHNFSLTSLLGVIQYAGKRRAAQGPMGGKLNTTQADFGRPSSSQSVAPVGSRDRGSYFGQQKDKKPSTPSALSPAAKLEHAYMLQSLLDCIGPRLNPDELNIFFTILRDVFYGLPKTPQPPYHVTKEQQDFENSLLQYTRERGLVAHQPWIIKINQLRNLSKQHHGIIVAGPPGTGKSSCISALIETLTECSATKHKNTGSPMHTHKLQKVYPLGVSDPALMFGRINTSGDFEDGIFTAYWRKANKEHSVHQMTTWICLDAPLHHGWAEMLSSVLDNGGYLSLLNSERMYLSEDVKLLFETDDLANASPATVSRSAIVYMDESVLGWRPLAEAWLANRSPQEVHCLQRAFNKTVDAISQFVQFEARPHLKICEVGLFSTCLAMVKALIEGNTDIGGELHIERLYLFSLIWSFGSLLDDHDRKKFSEILLSLTTALPDYDQEISVFDYYVDESGEWDPWQSKVPDVSYFDAADLLGEVFVETVDTVRTRMFMDLASTSGRNILLTGPRGCGKTSLINDFLDKQEDKNQIVKRYVFSGTSKAVSLQQFIENNIYHRQGFVFGAKKGKALNMFIDDLSIPQPDDHGVQEVNELLRQVLDQQVFFNTKKPFDRRVLEGVSVTSAVSLHNEQSTSGQPQRIPERLKRHFAMFYLPAPIGESLFTVVNSVLEANMAQNQGMGLPQDFHDQIVTASCQLLTSVQNVLRPSPTPGRCHYQFNLRDLTRVFQGLKNCSEEMRADDEYVVSLWQHEVMRVMKDRVCRASDVKWFEKNLKNIVKENFPTLPANSPPPVFITFPLDPGSYSGRTTTQARTAAPKSTLQSIENVKEVAPCLQNYLRRYNDEFTEGLGLMVSTHVMYHVIRLHRILSFKNRGNALLVGAIGTHLHSLAHLAMYMLEYPIHPVDCSYPNTFLDGLRSAVRQAGCDGKTTTVVLTAEDLKQDMYLDALNSLLISGEYPPLFSEDELDSLLQALMPAIKRKFSSFLADPMKFFITRVKANLHIVLCLPPTHRLLRVGSSHYPGILYGCQTNWVKDWPIYALEGEATHYLAKYDVCQGIEDQIREKVVASVSTIHGHVLRECHQMPWGGNYKSLRPASVASPPSDEDNDLLLSKNILLERITLKHQSSGGSALGNVFVGPTTYIQFMHCFRHIFRDKRREHKERVHKLSLALATLDQTRKDAIIIKDVISQTKQQLEVATIKSDDLLKALTSKATVLEKLKAKLGIGSTTLSAFVALIDSEMDEEDADLLQVDEEDELDEEFEKIKMAKMKSRKLKVLEEMARAEQTLVEAKAQLKKAEDHVLKWQAKVDRSLCERLRAFQSPPPMAGIVMVMVMVLMGRPEFAAGIGGAGSTYTPGSRERTREPVGTSNSDETSRASSASRRRTGPIKGSSSSTQSTFYGVNSEGKVDRASWKSIQQIMNDSQRFVETLHHLNWKEGLSSEILRGVQSFFVTSSEGNLGVTDDLGSAAAGASASNYIGSPSGRSTATPSESRKIQGITIAAAKYSSEDAAVLVEYAIALVEYTRLYNPYRKAMMYLDELQREKEENEQRELMEANMEAEKTEEPEPEPEPELTEADLPGLEADVLRLQEEYDEAVVHKHNLANEVKSCSERLKAATDLLHSLKHMEREWKAYVEEYSSPEVLLANCIAASAFLTYCGPMGIDRRKRMGKYFMQVCRDNGLPIQTKHLFSRLTLSEFLKGKIKLKKWENLNLPTDALSLDNMCIATREESSDTWPLLCDPQRIAITWINTMLGQTTTVKYKELRGHLETCLMEGTTLLITDVDVNDLLHDTRFSHVIRSRYRFLTSTTPFKLMVGEHEIECQSGFRIVFATTSPADTVPSGLAAYVGVVEFCQSRDGLEDMFLDRFLRLEKPRMQDTRTQVVTEIVTHMDGLHDAEENILECLGSGHRLLYNLAATKKLASIRRLHEETSESLMRSRGMENSLLQSREGFRPIARRAAVMFDVARIMAEINPSYQTSLAQFLIVFDAAITHSERTAVKAVVERLGQSAFYSTARSLFEQDRPLFAILTALEVEDSANHLSAGDREFIIHPTYGATVKTALNPTLVSESASKIQGKKPFDWMMDEQFSNLQLLAQHFEWFQDPFDKMPKDGREMQWRQITEHEKPEMVALPDNLDDKYTPIQRFMVIRALRGDRVLQAGMCFVTSVLGKRYTSELSLDLPYTYRQSDCRTPIVLLYTQEANMVEKLVTEGAERKQVEIQIVALCNTGSNEERMARKLIHRAMQQGSWVLLHNAHNSPRLLSALDSLMHDTKTVDSEFRLWVSIIPTGNIPSTLLQSAVKVVADSPKSTKDSLQRSMTWVDNELLRISNRPEWPALLHNLCMLHSIVRLRTRFKLAGWNRPEDFKGIGTAELWQSLDLAVREFQDTADMNAGGSSRSIQWNGLRYMLSEVVYGSCVSDDFDRQGLSAIIDYWVSPAAVKKEFEAAKTKYKLPSALFTSSVRMTNVLSGMESVAGDVLELPEACCLHTSPETHLPDHQYVFTRLNMLLDRMASTDSLTHAVSDPSTLMPTSGVILQSSSAQAIGAGAMCVVEAGVFASASMVALRSRKEVDLNEVCTAMISKLPKVWNKESVYERMKKAGGTTPFNLFAIAEVESMSRLLVAVKESLVAIKAATDDSVYGDQLSEEMLDAADDLYQLRIPKLWCTLGGDASPPATWSLAAWFTDLGSRFSHIDRIVVQGRDRVPAYWLGAFFNPRRLLSIVKQEAVRNAESKASGTEPFVFLTEITGRDKDHLREPPLDGMFVYGIYLWGCAWEKTTGDLLDAPPKYGPTPLPVVHITVVPQTEKASLNDPLRAAVSYSCPCYASRICTRDPVMLLDIDNKDISGTRWPLRGLSSTLRPF